MKQTKIKLLIQAIFCTFLWGSAFPGIKIAYEIIGKENINFSMRLFYSGIRFFLAGIMIGIFFRKSIKKVNRKNLILLLGITLFQTVLQYIFFYWGLAVGSAVLGSILVSTGSFFMVLLMPLADKTEKITLKQIIILILGFFGVFISLLTKNVDSSKNIFSAFLFLSAAFCGSIAVVQVRLLKNQISSTYVNIFSLGMGGLLLLALGINSASFFFLLINIKLVLLTIYLSFVSAAAFIVWYKLINEYSIAILSGYRFLIPLFGITESYFILPDEKITFNIFIGGFLVITSIYFLNRNELNS